MGYWQTPGHITQWHEDLEGEQLQEQNSTPAFYNIPQPAQGAKPLDSFPPGHPTGIGG